MDAENNHVGLDGIEFVEFCSAEPDKLHQLFLEFGFSYLMRHEEKNIDYYRQGDIHFLLNRQADSLAEKFHQLHGPSICSMGWRVKDKKLALKSAVQRGATAVKQRDLELPAVSGIGGSLIYFADNYSDPDRYQAMGFKKVSAPVIVPDKGFTLIDHLTNNVEKGEMKVWADFYKNVFGFKEVRYFDIKGAKTGLTSYALRSPCGKFCIPINEGNEEKSQINEYLREYKGAGIQHLAFLTDDILRSVRQLKESSSIETLDIDDEYYDEVFDRVPNVTEDHKEIKDLAVLVDGDDDGYLLQIFTRNIIGPIFIEIIQRNNHLSFGEGNFGALFRSIERDQEKRGVI